MTETSADAYMAALRTRVEGDKYKLTEDQVGPVHAIVGRRFDFRVLWMATALHTYVIATAVAGISEAIARDFEEQAATYARKHKPGLPIGFQNGVAIVSVLAAPSVDPAAGDWARGNPRKRFGVLHLPAVVDLSTGTVHTYRDRIVLGGVYSKFLRTRQRVALGEGPTK